MRPTGVKLRIGSRPWLGWPLRGTMARPGHVARGGAASRDPMAPQTELSFPHPGKARGERAPRGRHSRPVWRGPRRCRALGGRPLALLRRVKPVGRRFSWREALWAARAVRLPARRRRSFLWRLFPGQRSQGPRCPVGHITLNGGKVSGWTLGPLPDPRPRAGSSRCRAPPLQLRGESRCRGPPSGFWDLGAGAWEDQGWLPFWTSRGGGRGLVLTAELL